MDRQLHNPYYDDKKKFKDAVAHFRVNGIERNFRTNIVNGRMSSSWRKIVKEYAGRNIFLPTYKEYFIKGSGKWKSPEAIFDRRYNEKRVRQSTSRKINREIQTANPSIYTLHNTQTLHNIALPMVSADPKDDMYQLLRGRRGQRLLMVVRGTMANGGYYENNVEMNLPEDDREFTRYFRRNFRTFFMVDSDEYIFTLRDGYIKFFRYETVANLPVAYQSYLKGNYHCFFSPIHTWAVGSLINLEDKAKKWSIARVLNNKRGDFNQYPPLKQRKTMIKKCERYIEEYKCGVPEFKIDEIVRSLNVSIEIYSFFSKGDPYLKVTPRDTKHKFCFLNTRINHLDIIHNLTADIQTVSQFQMNELKAELDANNQGYVYRAGKAGIREICFLDKRYVCENNYNLAIKRLDKLYDFHALKFDFLTNEKLYNFIAPHYGGHVDFRPKQLWCNYDNLKHIDCKASYFNFFKCTYYDGFPNRLTDFRPCDRIYGEGFYLIYDLIIHNEKFLMLNDYLGNPFRSNNVYAKPLLLYLRDMGCTFKVKYGAYSIRKFDFRFTDEMLEKHDNVRMFSKWTGLCDMNIAYDIWYVGGSNEKDFSVALQQKSKDIGVFWSPDLKSIKVECPKKRCMCMPQITNYITSFQTINVVRQLMNFSNLANVMRVAVDGIYYINESPDLVEPFRHKNEINLNNIAGQCYLSSISDDPTEFMDLNYEIQNRPSYSSEIHTGEGGAGKTYYNLSDEGFLQLCYCAPSRKLSRSKKKQYKNVMMNAVYHNVIDRDDYHAYHEIQTYSNVIMIDEVSMLNKSQYYKARYRYPSHKIILAGDPEYQLEPITGHRVELTDLEYHKHHIGNKRSVDPEFTNYQKNLRKLIDSNISLSELNYSVYNYFKSIGQVKKISEIDYDYKTGNIFVSKKNKKSELTNKFKRKPGEEEKYIITKTSREYSRGDIIFSNKKRADAEVCHANTIHSVQGEDVDGKIYIYACEIFSRKMFYSAISRARRLSQIILVIDDKDPIYKDNFEFKDEIDDKYVSGFIYSLTCKKTGKVMYGCAINETDVNNDYFETYKYKVEEKINVPMKKINTCLKDLLIWYKKNRYCCNKDTEDTELHTENFNTEDDITEDEKNDLN